MHFPPIFWIFAIFDHHFLEVVAPSSDENENHVLLLKGRSTEKRTMNTTWKSTHKLSYNTCSNCVPSNEVTNNAPASGRYRQQKHNDKHHIFAPTAGARCTIFPKLCTVLELVEAIKKGANQFSIQRLVFPTGCTEKLGLNARFLSNKSVICEAKHVKYETLM